MGPITFGLLVFDGVEVLDACGPFEVFSVAGRVGERGSRVLTIARTSDPVSARGGLRIVPDHTLETAPPFDVLIVPGGVTDAPESDPATIAWIAQRHAQVQLTASICTGATLLATAGILDGRPATTHWSDEDELARRFPAIDVRRAPRWVDDGDVITSAGISAGIDMSLHVVRRLFGDALARETAYRMEYEWRDHV
jgi:transcriptional regulator GlxA family with amidase domain